ncbi:MULTISPECIES: DUF4326 domain-containing protein [unclassified Chelatococcus]|uniref:DUF4326 domain-containing protein n=1 Tax=unclassified Chelatococcus TaxID=2638111 RepID=UPI001BCB4848|nr:MULTISPECIES: DUF4326 domain-containing protein [unclassified Chelatococcus]MBS7698741.1 DUF4326 domain-containing protein [Chelatococcus sp. YT9]MBX3554677.1 DUF4326 domain-containing protein [Chelatococcus sp.]
MPERVQLRRTKGWRMPPNTAKVDRSSGFGNPFRVVPATIAAGEQAGTKEWWVETDTAAWRFKTKADAQAASVRAFAATATDSLKDRARLALRGKNLACWCTPDQPCHADILLKLANKDPA